MSLQSRTLPRLLIWGAITIAPAQAADDPITRFIQQQQIDETVKASEDQFGTSVALWGDTALVGAPGDDSSGTASGAVHVFTQDTNGQWQEKQKLSAANGTAGDLFGTALALHDGIAVIGAHGDNAQGSFAGAAYIFVRDAQGVWNKTQKLVATDGAAGNLFGWSVALDEGIIVIGARGNEDRTDYSGAVYVFMQGQTGVWTEVQKLTPSDGSARDNFGANIAVYGETILIGAPGRDDKSSATGAAYLFIQEESGHWRELQKLTASDASAGDEFGYSVALKEETALVGARFAKGSKDQDGNGETDRIGAVYVFAYGASHIGTQWSEAQKLLPSGEETSREFGYSLALSETTALVGVRGDAEGGSATGSVYVFALQSDTESVAQWREQQKIRARDGAAGDEFGASVALFDEVAIIGAPLDDIFEEGQEEKDKDDESDDETFTNVGSAYIVGATGPFGSCTVRTDYANAQCRGTFAVASLADLDQYIAEDFGRKDNKDRYQHLVITASLEDAILVIESPCAITIERSVTLTGDFIRLDGRGGVLGQNFDAGKVCVVSEQGDGEIRSGAIVNVDALTMTAAKNVHIGRDAAVDVEGLLELTSTGNTSTSDARIETGAIVHAGSVTLASLQKAELGDSVILTTIGSLQINASGLAAKSVAGIGTGTQVQAAELTIRSSGKAQIGADTDLTVSGDLRVASTSGTVKSHVLIKEGAQLVVTGNATITSGNKVTIEKNTAVTVSQNLQLEAAQCKVHKAAVVTAGATSGSCL